MYISSRTPGLSAAYYTLAGGRDGIIQTAQVMRDMVEQFKRDPEIRRLALHLVETLSQKDHVSEVERLFSYVQNEIRYVQDIYDIETIATPDQIVALGQGDCDDKAVLLATLLESIGFQTSFKLAGYNGPNFEHVYVHVQGNGIPPLHLDPTEPEPMGYEPPGATVSLYVG